LVLPSASRDHIRGSIDAPLALIEYGDYECPYCGEAEPIVQAVRKALGDRLCFAFRNFPLVNAHPHAEHAAEAAEAAGAQGHFWEMHDLLFERQDALEDENLWKYALSLRLDADRLMRDALSGAYAERLREDIQSGMRNGVHGTPSFFVNGIAFDEELNVEGLLAILAESS
jgi:protein-disulfide isomerase